MVYLFSLVHCESSQDILFYIDMRVSFSTMLVVWIHVVRRDFVVSLVAWPRKSRGRAGFVFRVELAVRRPFCCRRG